MRQFIHSTQYSKQFFPGIFLVVMVITLVAACGSDLNSVGGSDKDANGDTNSNSDADTDTDTDADGDTDTDTDTDTDADMDADTDTDADTDSDTDTDADSDGDIDPASCNRLGDCYGDGGCLECAKDAGVCKDLVDACRSDATCADFELCYEQCRADNNEFRPFLDCYLACDGAETDALAKYNEIVNCVHCEGCANACAADYAAEDCMEPDTGGDGDSDADADGDADEFFDPIDESDSTGLAEIGSSGESGKTTRYWDCCKPSCGWNNGGYTPTTCCTQSNAVHTNSWDSQSGCSGGDVYTCWNNRPWAVNSKLAYGFTAVQAGSWQFGCGECIQLEFTTGAVKGKTMVVQVTNIGGDVDGDQFDLMIPGGGVGLFDGCSKQWGVNSSELGDTYGGFYSWCLDNEPNVRDAIECTIDKCNSVFSGKPDLQDGCMWFIRWFRASNNPAVKWKKVDCPQELKNISGM